MAPDETCQYPRCQHWLVKHTEDGVCWECPLENAAHYFQTQPDQCPALSVAHLPEPGETVQTVRCVLAAGHDGDHAATSEDLASGESGDESGTAAEGDQRDN